MSDAVKLQVAIWVPEGISRQHWVNGCQFVDGDFVVRQPVAPPDETAPDGLGRLPVVGSGLMALRGGRGGADTPWSVARNRDDPAPSMASALRSGDSVAPVETIADLVVEFPAWEDQGSAPGLVGYLLAAIVSGLAGFVIGLLFGSLLVGLFAYLTVGIIGVFSLVLFPLSGLFAAAR